MMLWLTTKHRPAYTDVPGDWTDRRGGSNDGPALGIGDEDGVVIEGATAAEIATWLRRTANRIDPAGARAVAAGAIRDAVSTVCNGEQLHDEHVRYCVPLLEHADLIAPLRVDEQKARQDAEVLGYARGRTETIAALLSEEAIAAARSVHDGMLAAAKIQMIFAAALRASEASR